MKNFKNYQLYRSNVNLGGQMKYDLVIGKSGGEDLVVEEFHISPISKDMSYNRESVDNLLNYTHQENIKRYYRENSGCFYKDFIPTEMKDEWPIVGEDEVKNYNDEWEMGCRRMSYSLYKKQFQFFVPLWIEKYPLNSWLEFQFEIYSNTSPSPILTKNLKLKFVSGSPFHNKFYSYWNKYVNYVGLRDGNNNILNIDPNKDSFVKAFSVKNGLNVVKSVNNIKENLFKREIPMMDFDNIITNILKDNSLIATQLFNFNLCFNLEDLLPSYMLEMMMGGSVRVGVRAAMGKSENGVELCEPLETVDFYSNYEFIPREFSGPTKMFNVGNQIVEVINDRKVNALDYLSDYNYVDYVGKNKVSQQTIHWSLVKSNSYLFNAYNGLGSWYLSKGENGEEIVEKVNYFYGKTADTMLENYNESRNSLSWCNNIYINSKSGFSEFDVGFNEHIRELKKYYSEFAYDTMVNNVYYSKLQKETKSFNVESVKLLMIWVDGWMSLNIKEGEVLKTGGRLLKIDDVFVVIDLYKNRGNYTYQKFLSIIEQQMTNSEYSFELEFLSNLMNNCIDRSSRQSLHMSKSLDVCPAPSPILSTKEIEYYKNEDSHVFLHRYFGDIRPTFIKKDDEWFNYRYFKKVMSEEEFKESTFAKYCKSNYLPHYPSIGYYSLENEKEMYEDGKDRVGCEWNKYNTNKIFLLKSEFEVELKSKIIDNEYVKVKDLVRDWLGEYYNISNDKELNYIFSLYTFESSFEYEFEENNIRDYIYSVKIMLK